MTKEEINRINYLSEKVVYKTATPSEKREFERLLRLWHSNNEQVRGCAGK